MSEETYLDMKELILKELLLNRTLDTCNDFVLWADISDLEVLADKLEKAINCTHCCTEFADGKCRPMVNADWTYLRCECGNRFTPKG